MAEHSTEYPENTMTPEEWHYFRENITKLIKKSDATIVELREENVRLTEMYETSEVVLREEIERLKKENKV